MIFSLTLAKFKQQCNCKCLLLKGGKYAFHKCSIKNPLCKWSEIELCELLYTLLDDLPNTTTLDEILGDGASAFFAYFISTYNKMFRIKNIKIQDLFDLNPYNLVIFMRSIDLSYER